MSNYEVNPRALASNGFGFDPISMATNGFLSQKQVAEASQIIDDAILARLRNRRKGSSSSSSSTTENVIKEISVALKSTLNSNIKGYSKVICNSKNVRISGLLLETRLTQPKIQITMIKKKPKHRLLE